jgi:serine/threonine-protein kinase RsbW
MSTPREGTGAVNEARLVVRSGPLVGAVLSRVVGMLAARALCPIDRLDDALLITDAIAAHASDFTVNGTVGVTVMADEDAITMLVSPLRAQGAEGLLRAAELPGVGNVLERVADEVTTGQTEDGSAEELRVRLAFHPG